MSLLVDRIALTCPLTPWEGDPQRCRGCNDRIHRPRRIWCSTACQQEWKQNHVWYFAKQECRRRQPSCVDCHADPQPRPGLLEVDHTTPVKGNRHAGCQHHQANLRTRCEHHHELRHSELAALAG